MWIPKIGSEDHEQALFANWLRGKEMEGMIVKFSHINNELWTKSYNQKSRMVQLGSPAGLPDFIIAAKSKIGTCCLFFIEMKNKNKKGKLSKKQIEWKKAFELCNEFYYTCNGHYEAERLLEDYYNRAI